MEKVDNNFLSILNRLSFSRNGKAGIKTYWRMIMILYIAISVLLVAGGWFCYAWAITSSSIIVQQKKLRISISIDEVRKAEVILSQKKGRLEETIMGKVDVAGLK